MRLTVLQAKTVVLGRDVIGSAPTPSVLSALFPEKEKRCWLMWGFVLCV